MTATKSDAARRLAAMLVDSNLETACEYFRDSDTRPEREGERDVHAGLLIARAQVVNGLYGNALLTLAPCHRWFEAHADADLDGFRPNPEMRALAYIEQAREQLERMVRS